MKTLTFLHTSPVHIATFEALLAESGKNIPVKHVVAESLLQEAQTQGAVTPELAKRVQAVISAEFADGAAVVLCTCSTIGGVAEKLANTLRVDRPMAAKAVSLGNRIALVAALATTFVPTTQLILEEAQKSGKAVELTEVLCGKAWEKFLAGDKPGYLEEIAEHLQNITGVDVIVLAQASMADAALLVNLAIPILSSPRLGLETAIQSYELRVTSYE